ATMGSSRCGICRRDNELVHHSGSIAMKPRHRTIWIAVLLALWPSAGFSAQAQGAEAGAEKESPELEKLTKEWRLVLLECHKALMRDLEANEESFAVLTFELLEIELALATEPSQRAKALQKHLGHMKQIERDCEAQYEKKKLDEASYLQWK